MKGDDLLRNVTLFRRFPVPGPMDEASGRTSQGRELVLNMNSCVARPVSGAAAANVSLSGPETED